MQKDMLVKKNYDEMCKRIGKLIIGSHKPTYKKSNKFKGDICIVVNAEKIQLKGRELRFRKFKYHTGSPGGLIEKSFIELLENKPESLIFYGVHKQMEANRVREGAMKRCLKVYTGPEVKYADFLPNVI